MASSRLNLTKAAIDALPPAAPGKRAYYYDTKAKGLVVAVTDRGTKSFMVYRWVNGRPERITLGRYASDITGGLTIEQARKAAADTNLSIARGENPAEKKRALRGEYTLGELAKEYFTRHSDVHNRRPDKPKANYRLYLSHWDSRKLSQITRKDTTALHARLGRDVGKVTANIAMKLLRAMFNKAIDWELWDKPNPATGVKHFKERTRDRFIQPDELPLFFAALNTEPNDIMRDYFFVSLVTGARRSNVQSMGWEDVSLVRAEWRIPDTKADEPHVVPLLPEAVAVLKRREESKVNKYVFPGNGKTGHLVEPKKAWRRVLDRAELNTLNQWIVAKGGKSRQIGTLELTGPALNKALRQRRADAKALGIDPSPARIKNLRIHDLRRTLGSWQAATGASLHMIGRTLQHANVSTTAIYARLNLDPVRESMQKATTAILAAGGIASAGKVLPMKKRK